ncbi:hypothetical protein [Streptomyces fulvoviolaceus]|uniref:hypothetical protein n=1 Tax=Streptomyces fulvoviolaceus TaxID=285535 RepID=UPI0004C67DE3|nr:hypothetical protein [Streptomyces fulvoviolaceus]MCT9080933.1 hypothetical protein [Streptomyces fulvoviolaceus]
MIVLQPVLEIHASDGFTLWPVAESGPYGYLPLSGRLDPAEVGTAVMRIAECNNIDPEDDGRPPRPTDPLGGFLHGLLTMDDLFASGGLRIADTATGTTLLPGCCNGLDERRDWLEAIDGKGWASFGHDPSPLAERHGEVVRLTVDAEHDDSPVIELPVTDLRRLLADAERDLIDFLQLAAAWAALHLPDHATPVTSALGRALDLPTPVAPPNR